MDMDDILSRLRAAVDDATEVVLCGGQPTCEQNKELQALADRLKFMRNFSICLDRDSLPVIGRKHNLSHVRISQIKGEGVPRIFAKGVPQKSGRPALHQQGDSP